MPLKALNLSIGDEVEKKYRIDRVLGVGGMGVVVAATHIELDELVALKFLGDKKLWGNERSVTRFLREAKAAVKVKTEHVARVSDVGRIPGGAPFIVMEYLEGRDLRTVIDADGAQPAHLAVEHLLQVCEAVAHAHALGVIHRDIKPANLFLTHRPDGSRCVKVLDFGVSKLPGGSAAMALTKTTAMLGSPLYMAPEMWGSARDADARSDIWSMGVVLYELLSGEVPFPGEGMAQVCNHVMHSEPEDLRGLGIDEGLADVVERCLAKRADDRYANVAELASALMRFSPNTAQIAGRRAIAVLHAKGDAANVRAPLSERQPPGAITHPTGTPATLSSIEEAGSPRDAVAATRREGSGSARVSATTELPLNRSLTKWVVVAAVTAIASAGIWFWRGSNTTESTPSRAHTSQAKSSPPQAPVPTFETPGSARATTTMAAPASSASTAPSVRVTEPAPRAKTRPLRAPRPRPTREVPKPADPFDTF